MPLSPNTRPQVFLAAEDRDAARAFFTEVLGLSLVADTPFALVFDAFGTELRVTFPPQVVRAPYTVAGFIVEDLDRELAGLGQAGVTCLRFPGLPQDDQGVWQTPDGARIVWFPDPTGNVLSLVQPPA